MDLRVTQFARTFGLSPGLNPPTTQLPTFDALMGLLYPDGGLTKTEKEEFHARSAAEYLPSIFKIVSETSVSPDNLANALRLSTFIANKPGSPYDRRFVREHGDEAVGYFLALLRVVYQLPNKLFQLSAKEDQQIMSEIVLALSRALRQQLDDLVAAYPGSSFPVPPVSDAQQLILRRLAQIIESNPRLDQGGVEKDRLLSTLLDAIPKLGDTDLDATRANGTLGIPALWNACEWLRAEWGKEGDVKCVELKDGEELQACSRCLTVRYCSKKHQKLHWKHHKHRCFKSSW